MDILRARAFSTYLQHALSSALTVDSIIAKRDDQPQDYSMSTVVASATWVRFCKTAQTVCGVYGLVAIDRAESRLLHCLQCECSFHSVDRTASEEQLHRTHREPHLRNKQDHTEYDGGGVH
jgi:hypothetical protein